MLTLTLTYKRIGLWQQEPDDPGNRAAGLLALREVADAPGGLAMVAAQADSSREALRRSLSPKAAASQSARWNPLIDHGL